MSKMVLDKYDRIVAVSSGVLAASLDVFGDYDLSLEKAHENGQKFFEKTIMTVAKKKGYKGESLADAIDFLEDKAPIIADKATNDFGGGKQHHLRDFSHHPTIVGLISSILNELTGYGFGTDTSGKFIVVKIEEWEKKGFVEAIYSGTVNWVLHLLSDVCGASGSVRNNKEGTGIPGPLLAHLKELSSISLIRNITGYNDEGNNKFSVTCSKMFNGTLLAERDDKGKIIKEGVKFDFRTELGLVYEPIRTKQYMPVLLCEGIVCAFYSIRRLCEELKEKNVNSIDDLEKIDFKKFLPWKSDVLRRMRTISSITFSSIDLSVAAIKAYKESDGNIPIFVIKLMTGVNYFGIGRLIISGKNELRANANAIYDEYKGLTEAIEKKSKPIINTDIKENINSVANRIYDYTSDFKNINFTSAAIKVYKEIEKAVQEYNEAREERIRIEEECQRTIEILDEYKSEMEQMVSEHMLDRLNVFGAALDMIDKAINIDDTDGFIEGNNMIQDKLGSEVSFTNQDEFDSLMLSDDDFVL